MEAAGGVSLEAANGVGAMSAPRLGFLGLGWIGRHRLEAVAASGSATVAALADPSPEAVAAAQALAPDADVVDGLAALLALDLDGLVIATPNDGHADQSMRALDAGLAVFCQKPLARTADEARRVVDAARAADRLLGVDLSYRHIHALDALRAQIQHGDLGTIYAADLVFHNAYGPGKTWCYDLGASGGGCVLDLGVHLVDLALWLLGDPIVAAVEAHLYGGGQALPSPPDRIEDYAVATLGLADGATVRLACSWNLPVGQDAAIEARLYGTQGGAIVRNVGGSFYDFCVGRTSGAATTWLGEDRGTWGGGALLDWTRRLQHGGRFDPDAERLVTLHAVLDRVYGRTCVGE